VVDSNGKVNILGAWCIIKVKNKNYPTVFKEIKKNKK